MNGQTERRRYVRIKDTILLCVRPIEEYEKDGVIASPERQLAYQFQQLENHISVAMSRVRAKSPDTAELVSFINQKINTTFQAIQHQNSTSAYNLEDVNISACGVSIESISDFKKDQSVWISMLLPPFNQSIETKGIVVGVEPDTADINLPTLRIDYEELGPEQEETLIQYVIRRQSEQLSRNREQSS